MATMQEATELSLNAIAAWEEAMLPGNIEKDYNLREFIVGITLGGETVEGNIKH